MKRLIKWILILLLVLLFLVLLVSGAVYAIAGTNKGFSLAAEEISKRVEGLTFTSAGGNLVDGIKTNKLNYEDQSIKVEAVGMDSQWQLSCLTQKEFCLNKIAVESVDIEILNTSENKEPTTSPIELPDITLPIGAKIENVLINTLRIKLPGDAPPHIIKDIHLTGHASGSDVRIDDLSANYQDYSARVSGEISMSGDYPLDLDIKLNALDILPDELPDGAGMQPVEINAALTQSLHQLKIHTVVSGTVDATLSGLLQPLDPQLPADLVLTSGNLGWPVVSKQQIWASNNRVSINGSLDDYKVSLFTFIQGEEVPPSTIQLTANINQEQAVLPVISIDTLDGNAVGRADVSWKDELSWNTSWNLKNLEPGVYRADLAGELSGQVKASGAIEDGNWSLAIPVAKIEGEFQGYPFKLDVKASKNLDNLWSIEKAQLNNGKNRVTASGSVGKSWDIDALADLPELRKLLPDLNGAITAKVSLKGNIATPDIDILASSSAFAFNETKVSGFVLKADIDELLDQNSDINLAVGQVVMGENTIRNGRFGFTGSRQQHKINVFADGPQATAIDLNASGSLSDDLNWDGSLDKVTLEVPAHTIKLASPTELAWDNNLQKLAIDAHCWITEGSNLCLKNKVLAEASGTAQVSLDQYSLQRLNPFLPAKTTLTGQLSLDTTIKWGEGQRGGFGAQLQARVINGGAEVVDANDETVRFTYDTLELDTNANPQNVNADIRLASKSLGKASVQFTLDPSKQSKPIDGSIALDGFDLSIAQAFLPDFDEISGNLNVGGDISGSLTDPRFNGEIVINTPVIRSELLPLPITGGEIITTVKGRRAFIDGELASDDGSITLEGSANWREIEAWAGQLTLIGDSLNIQSDPIQESKVYHTITIDANPRAITVRGDVEIPNAIIDVEELPQGAARVSSDVVIIEDIDEQLTHTEEQADTSADGPQLLVDVNVTLGENIALSAYGLTANLTGTMNIRQKSPNPPQLGGEIEVVNGIYKQYGQNLAATGQVLFVGPINQTRLAIDAVRTIDSEDRVAGLRIQGTTEKPEIVLFTEPADKQQDAILSYIVLGRDISEASNQEASLLTSAALALTVRGGRSIAGGIASAMGVKDFALETRGRGDDTELVVSGRLNDRLLLRYGRSVFQPESTLYLRYDLTKKLYLEAAQNAESAVDLFYSFSF